MDITTLQTQLYNLKLKEENRKEKQRERSRRSYNNRYKITPDMGIEEKLNVQRNIQKRKESARRRYVGQTKENQKERAKKRYIPKKKEAPIPPILPMPNTESEGSCSD
mgnify:FL=1